MSRCFQGTETGWCRKKMKIGFPNHPRKNILKEIEWIGKKRFDFVDLFLEEDSAVPEKINIKEVKKLLKKYNLNTVGHTAFYLPIGSPVKLFRESAVKEAERYFKIFKKLGVRYITIHANWPPSMFSEKEGIKLQVETLKKLVGVARRYKLKIMYEPLDGERDALKNVSFIMKKVNRLYFHLDIGHANLFGRNPVSFIKKFHKKLRHIHLHDNKGKEDEHKAIGKGNINFKRIVKELKKYKYDGTITLEIFEKNKKLTVQSQKKLKKLWESL